MFQLSSPAPVTKELIAANGARPAVAVTFNPQPSPLSLRFARAAVAEVMRDGMPEQLQRAADAFTAAVIRYNIISWSGIGDANGEPVPPTHDREIKDDDDNVVGIESGSISAFLAEPRLVEAADREYVIPWTESDREKNGSSASVSGTTAAAMPESDIASSPADIASTADAGTTTPAPPPAPTTSTPAKRKRGKRSGN